MDCPICGEFFQDIQSHVEFCLDEQDVINASKIEFELNEKKTEEKKSPDYNLTEKYNQLHQINSNLESHLFSKVLGTTQYDIDIYNSKMIRSYEEIKKIYSSLEKYNERIHKMTISNKSNLTPSFQPLKPLPLAKYMKIMHLNNSESQLDQVQTKSRDEVPPNFHSQIQASALIQHENMIKNTFLQSYQNYNQNLAPSASSVLGYKDGPDFEQKINSETPAGNSNFYISPKILRNQKSYQTESLEELNKIKKMQKGKSQTPQNNDKNPKEISDIQLAQIESKWLYNISEFPDDTFELIYGHLSMIFDQNVFNTENKNLEEKSKISTRSIISHPISEYVYSLIKNWNEPFSKMQEPSLESLNEATKLVKGYISTIQEVILDYYPVLSVKSLPPHSSQAQYNLHERREVETRKAVEQAIWPFFYTGMMELIKATHSTEDEVYDEKIKEFQTIHPGHLGIPHDYWLIEEDLSSVSQNQNPPYYNAVSILKTLTNFKEPRSKLNCLLSVAKSLVDSVTSFNSSHGKNSSEYVVGGDELLPIFTYIVIRSGVKNFISESSFMELFIDDEQSRNQNGYILATLQTSLSFICCLDQSIISKSTDSVFKELEKQAIIKSELVNQENKNDQNVISSLPNPSPTDYLQYDNGTKIPQVNSVESFFSPQNLIQFDQ